MWRTLKTREFPPILCELRQHSQSGEWAIRIIRATAIGVWEGWAVFPREMEQEAIIRWSILHKENDVEALLREWAEDGVYEQYQTIMAGE